MKLRIGSRHVAALAALALVIASDVRAQRADYYADGMILAETDDWISALDVWSEGQDELTTQGRYDPRIGVAYLELVTERQASGYYESASDIFLWGFSGTDFTRYREVILEEARRIQPLLDEDGDEWRRWDKMIEGQDPRLPWEIKRFWLEKDPTPGTPYHERLIEHWERIAYARKNYGNERYGPYDTDDRGTFFVRFGPPDKRQRGVMGADDFELRLRIPPDNPDAIEARNRLSLYDYHPNYEIWAYDALNPQDITFYLFGNYQATGRFQLLRSPRDLIHPSAWSGSSRRATPGNIKAAYYMELFYYGELAKMGGPYGRRHNELESYWDRMQGAQGRATPNEETLDGFSVRYRSEDAFGPQFPALVPVLSEYEGSNREMELVAMATRLLSENDEPQLVMIALSSPRTFVEGVRALRRFKLEEGMVRHTLIVRDEALIEIGRITDRVSSDVGDISTFTLRHLPRNLHYTVLGEVVRSGNRPRPDRRYFPGQAHLQPAEPLSPDPDRLEISDIVTGLPIPDQFDPRDLFFPLVPSRTIWRRDPLRIYFEVYHLRPEANGLHHYSADLRMARFERDTEIVDAKNPPVTLRVELESADPRSQRVFDLNVRDLLVGNYRLEVTITDLTSGESKSRVVALKLLR